MTVKERINELLDAANKPDAGSPERNDLIEQARRLCREHKIGMGTFNWPTASGFAEPGDGAGEHSTSAEEEPSGPRTIGKMVEQLLLDPTLNYVEIANRVRAHFRHARTTNRSVASVAKDMRAKGANVAPRRSPRAKTNGE